MLRASRLNAGLLFQLPCDELGRRPADAVLIVLVPARSAGSAAGVAVTATHLCPTYSISCRGGEPTNDFLRKNDHSNEQG